MPDPILTDLETIASKTAAQNGFELCRLQLLTHQIPITMQVHIRHKDGDDVSLEDCARFSEPMSNALESSQLLKKAYVLEISSPGISDQLLSDKDFQTFRGFPIEVTFKDDSDAELQQSGLLHERSEKHLHINIKGRMSRINRDSVINVRLTSPTV